MEGLTCDFAASVGGHGRDGCCLCGYLVRDIYLDRLCRLAADGRSLDTACLFHDGLFVGSLVDRLSGHLWCLWVLLYP